MVKKRILQMNFVLTSRWAPEDNISRFSHQEPQQNETIIMDDDDGDRWVYTQPTKHTNHT
jgi:hypothetical protein